MLVARSASKNIIQYFCNWTEHEITDVMPPDVRAIFEKDQHVNSVAINREGTSELFERVR